MSCEQELCPNWSGDGNVCPCALFGIGKFDDDDPVDVQAVRCRCDGANYFTEEQNAVRVPFLVHPDCQIHNPDDVQAVSLQQQVAAELFVADDAADEPTVWIAGEPPIALLSQWDIPAEGRAALWAHVTAGLEVRNEPR